MDSRNSGLPNGAEQFGAGSGVKMLKGTTKGIDDHRSFIEFSDVRRIARTRGGKQAWSDEGSGRKPEKRPMEFSAIQKRLPENGRSKADYTTENEPWCPLCLRGPSVTSFFCLSYAPGDIL
jgi:hypothetical protein